MVLWADVFVYQPALSGHSISTSFHFLLCEAIKAVSSSCTEVLEEGGGGGEGGVGWRHFFWPNIKRSECWAHSSVLQLMEFTYFHWMASC